MASTFSGGYLNADAFGPVASAAFRRLARLNVSRPLLDTDLLQSLLTSDSSWFETALEGTPTTRAAALARMGGALLECGTTDVRLAAARLGRMLRGLIDAAAELARSEGCPVIYESHIIRVHMERLSGNTSNLYQRLGIDPGRVRNYLGTRRADRNVTSATRPVAPPPLSPATPADEEPETTVSARELWGARYRVAGEIASGGMGIILLAYDERLQNGVRVAIKVMRPPPPGQIYLKRMFFREFESLARLNHPNIVRILDRGRNPKGDEYIVMEYISGTVLRSLMGKTGMQPRRVAGIVRQIGSALTCFHDRKILHCDLKPENIMAQSLGEDEELVKLIDFGVARVEESRMPSESGVMRIGGTLSYYSPEHIDGRLEAHSDIFSFGVIAYELLTGELPFVARTVGTLHEAYQRPLNLEPLRRAVPEKVVQVVGKALAIEPVRRYGRARDFAEELAVALTQTAPSALRAARPTQEVAYLLYIDPVVHQALPADQQAGIVTRLMECARGTKESMEAEASGDLLWLPSPDALVGAFRGDPSQPAECAVALARTLEQAGVAVRMAIGVGLSFCDDARAARVALGDIQTARAIAQLGDCGHILATRPVAEILRRLSRWESSLIELAPVSEGGRRFDVLNLCAAGGGNPARPSRWETVAVQPEEAATATGGAIGPLRPPVIEAEIPKGRTPVRQCAAAPPAADPAIAQQLAEPMGRAETVECHTSATAEGRVSQGAQEAAVPRSTDPVPARKPEEPMETGAATGPSTAEAWKYGPSAAAEHLPQTAEDPVTAVLARAEALARGAGVEQVGTAILLLALLDADEAVVGRHIDTRGAGVGAAHDVIRQLVDDYGPGLPPDVPVRLSENARAIVDGAARNAARRGGQSRNLDDLAAAFAEYKGSSASAILQMIGKRSKPTGGEVREVGGTKKSSCAPATWRILCRAAGLGWKGAVTTEALMCALYDDGKGPLGAALARLGVECPFTAKAQHATAGGAMVECSGNVSRILRHAGQRAAGRLIEPEDLLHGVVATEAGAAVEKLAEHLPALECIVSALFRNGGCLDPDRFENTAHAVLEAALAFARAKRHALLGKRHVLFAMLDADGGVMEERLAAQGVESHRLADLLHASTELRETTVPLALSLAQMEPELVRLLCGAERRAGGSPIGQTDLLHALYVAGAGDAAALLVGNSVKWRLLV